VLCFLCGTDWIIKYYLDELRLQRVNRILTVFFFVAFGLLCIAVSIVFASLVSLLTNTTSGLLLSIVSFIITSVSQYI
jgi:hypothetical protein